MDNLIISVGRQIGSGGNEIAKMLAHEFGCKFYDKEILNLAAEKSGFSPKIFERNDENHGLIHSASGFFERLFNPYSNSISDENLFQYPTTRMIRNIAGVCTKRLDALGSDALVRIIATGEPEAAAQANLYAMMRTYPLVRHFMETVVAEHYLNLGAFALFGLRPPWIRTPPHSTSSLRGRSSARRRSRATVPACRASRSCAMRRESGWSIGNSTTVRCSCSIATTPSRGPTRRGYNLMARELARL